MSEPAETLPQLLMRRPTLEGLARPCVPDGLCLRTAVPGDEERLARLLSDAFAEAWTAERVQRALTRAADVDRVYVVERAAEFLATASARLDPLRFPGAGYVHWVGTATAARGLGLGTAVTLAVLHRFVVLQCTSAVLETDDERLAAIRLYLRLGFLPVYRHPADPERWRRIAEALTAEHEHPEVVQAIERASAAVRMSEKK